MTVPQYLLISNICLAIFYLTYLYIAKNEINFKQLRFYLLFAIFVSLLLPLSQHQLKLGLFEESPQVTHNHQAKSVTINASPDLIPASEPKIFDIFYNYFQQKWQKVLLWIYSIISLFFIGKVIFQIGIFFKYLLKAEKKKHANYVIIYSKKTETAFSFFKWIFVPSYLKENKNANSIIAHEKIHASQYHSIDLIIIELLAAVMWFNPIVWMMRRSLQLIHEYQADEGALSTGIDRLKYQALLLNHVCEERIICLSSSFNHSLIKKRMLMISKSKFKQKTKLRILALIPLTVLLFLGIGVINAQNNNGINSSKKKKTTNDLPLVNNKTNQLKIGEIKWVGNKVFNKSELNKNLGLKKGDFYNRENFKQMVEECKKNSVASMYKNTGYFSFYVEIKESRVTETIVNLSILIHEGDRTKIDKVGLTGNKNIPEREIFELISIKTGEYYDVNKINESVKKLKRTGKFIEDKLTYQLIVVENLESGKMDKSVLLFTVIEK